MCSNLSWFSSDECGLSFSHFQRLVEMKQRTVFPRNIPKSVRNLTKINYYSNLNHHSIQSCNLPSDIITGLLNIVKDLLKQFETHWRIGIRKYCSSVFFDVKQAFANGGDYDYYICRCYCYICGQRINC